MRRLLFFPGHRLLAYEWERGAFRRVDAFEPDMQGRAAFRRWLAEAPRRPVQLLIDVIEEEFHTDRVPHVIGRDRQELLRRTLRKHFRSTEFRYIERQEREAAGRRDDRVLIAGLTNPEILRTWTDVIADAGVPLKGVHSLPLIGERLLPHLGAADKPRALLVSQQVPSTLRQSYYENGRLRFSRLVPGRYEGAQGFQEFLQRELRQTLHFLETQRFRRQDERVEVFVVASADVYERLRETLASDSRVAVHLVQLEQLAASVGMRGGLPGPYADTVFGHLLLGQWHPVNHYGLPRLRKAFFFQRGRQALAATAAACVLLAAVVGATAWLQGRAYEQGIDAARARTADFEALYRQRLAQLDAFQYRAPDVKNAVDLLSQLRDASRSDPEAAMAAIGRVLESHPRVVPQQLRWAVSAGRDPAPVESRQVSVAESSSLERAVRDATLFEHAMLTGVLVDFDGDYRRAVGLFEAFLAGLREDGYFGAVRVVKAPFDLDPESGFSGESGAGADGTDKQATFEVHLLREQRDGADRD